jgi:hypothetical protein
MPSHSALAPRVTGSSPRSGKSAGGTARANNASSVSNMLGPRDQAGLGLCTATALAGSSRLHPRAPPFPGSWD